MVRRFIPLIVLLSLAALLAIVLRDPRAASPSGRLVGEPMPELALGNNFSSALWHGKPVIINVFATWCAPCQQEHPLLMALAENGGIPLYGIAWKDTPEKVMAWTKTHGNPYARIGIDTRGDTTVALALTGVPETFVVDAEGVIRLHLNAPLTQDIVDTQLRPLMEALHAP